jgi:putative PIG3 family NAD(P)H quinone oxidoreductase
MSTMRVVEITRPGGPEVLEIQERQRPDPGPHEVLIRVCAAGLNRSDLLQRAGRYPVPADASDLPGLEVAGVVERVGDGVMAWRPGDAVCALCNGGGYAEYVAAPAGQCLPVPQGLDWAAAGALPEAAFTVWFNVFQRAGLARGESLLVHGGSSGIGILAIQMAKSLGATVYATAGTADKVAACERLGATRGIDYRREDFVEVIRRETKGRGVDVILDMVGGDYFPRNLEALAADGRLSQIATLGGKDAALDLSKLMRKRLTLTASTLRPLDAVRKAAIASELRATVWPLLDAGRIRPVIHAQFPLQEAWRAHQLMEAGGHIGKLVLEVAG